MFVPKSVSVVGHTYEVQVRDDEDFQDQFHGRVNLNEQIIQIAAQRGPDMQRETLVHEIFHAMADGLAVELNESEVQVLARAWYAVLKSNPNLVSYLTE